MDSDQPRVEELLRVNARLAAEVRSLTLGRTDAPRSGSMPVSRKLGKLIDERDALEQHLRETNEVLKVSQAHRAELERDNAELAATVAGLRSGLRGLVRRLFSRFSRR
ncbi:MAG TPA: hypothetical protein VF081_10715 [Solirubrobacterales bacterium]